MCLVLSVVVIVVSMAAKGMFEEPDVRRTGLPALVSANGMGVIDGLGAGALVR